MEMLFTRGTPHPDVTDTGVVCAPHKRQHALDGLACAGGDRNPTSSRERGYKSAVRLASGTSEISAVSVSSE